MASSKTEEASVPTVPAHEEKHDLSPAKTKPTVIDWLATDDDVDLEAMLQAPSKPKDTPVSAGKVITASKAQATIPQSDQKNASIHKSKGSGKKKKDKTGAPNPSVGPEVTLHFSESLSSSETCSEIGSGQKSALLETSSVPQTSLDVLKSSNPGCLPPWELVWEDESDYYEHGDFSKEESLLMAYQQAEGTLTQSQEEKDEVFVEEAYEAEEGDRLWRKFTRVLAKCPKQCARYCFGGVPLRMSDEHNGPSDSELKCPNCNRTRVFELQLLPTLCSEINSDFEWGTVEVYVCPASCQPGALVEEYCIRQAAW